LTRRIARFDTRGVRPNRVAIAILVTLLVTALPGCGSTLWLVTPRPDVTHYEVTRTATLEVTSTPPGATVLVDGAEAGVTPRRVAVQHRELRRQRRQAIWPALVGTLIDLAAFTILAVAAGQEEPAAGLLFGAAGAGVLVLDMYLITGRSVVNEGVDALPAAVEIGVRRPGFQEATRRVRVPDFTRLDFPLLPLPGTQEPAGTAPSGTPPPGTMPPGTMPAGPPPPGTPPAGS
jgi:hypothetical protein